MMRVKVSQWGARQPTRNCLRLIFNDGADIEKALATLPFTSPKLLPADAQAFCDRVNDIGGAATVVDA